MISNIVLGKRFAVLAIALPVLVLQGCVATQDWVREQLTPTESRVSTLEGQLKQSLAERAKLQEEIGTMKREAETAWAAERMENAVMRERINDVAAEVARLTSVLEGPGSPIDAILASDTARPAATPLAPAAGENGEIAVNGKGTLADRIRALQSRASRLPQPSRA